MFYAVHALFFRVKMVGRAFASVNFTRPTDRSQNFLRTKLLSDSETGRSVEKMGRTKSIIDSSIFHTKEQAVNHVVGLIFIFERFPHYTVFDLGP